MAEQIERYLETAGAQVRWKGVRPALERELRTHLEEQTEAYVSEGLALSTLRQSACPESVPRRKQPDPAV